MKERYFTRDQAEMICGQYQFLARQLFTNNKQNSPGIECVAVAPFDNLNKWLFVYTYEETDDPETALSFYGSDQFDVVLISHINGEITFTDIRSYMAAHHMKTNPLYFSLSGQNNGNNFPIERWSGNLSKMTR